jgi:hypothetical protein
MLWRDLLFDSWFDEPILSAALGSVFGVDCGEVLVVDEVRPDLDLDSVIVLAERTHRGGQFPLQLSVYLRDANLSRRMDADDTAVRLVLQLTARLNSACLLSVGPDESGEELLIRPDGAIFSATLDEELAERNEFVVIRSETIALTSPPAAAESAP